MKQRAVIRWLHRLELKELVLILAFFFSCPTEICEVRNSVAVVGRATERNFAASQLFFHFAQPNFSPVFQQH